MWASEKQISKQFQKCHSLRNSNPFTQLFFIHSCYVFKNDKYLYTLDTNTLECTVNTAILCTPVALPSHMCRLLLCFVPFHVILNQNTHCFIVAVRVCVSVRICCVAVPA